MRAVAPPSEPGRRPSSAARARPVFELAAAPTSGCKAWARSNPPAWPVASAAGLLATAVLRPLLAWPPASGGRRRHFVAEAHA
jgi:hypothetical protein